MKFDANKKIKFRGGLVVGKNKISNVDPLGGMYGAGIIQGIAINCEGEALGHGVWLEPEFQQEVVRQGYAKENGIKARFGHPNASGTALGTFLGRFMNFKYDGSDPEMSIARADLHISSSADKKYRQHVLDMAMSDPDMLGASIVFTPGEIYQRTAEGKKDYKLESGGKIYQEIKELHAADIVDDPAAAPNGLFSFEAGDGIAAAFTKLLDDNPKLIEVAEKIDLEGLDIAAFLQRYKTNKENKEMLENENQPDEGQVSEDAAALNVPAAEESATPAQPAENEAAAPVEEQNEEQNEESQESQLSVTDAAYEEGLEAGKQLGADVAKIQFQTELSNMLKALDDEKQKNSKLSKQLQIEQARNAELDAHNEKLQKQLSGMTAGFRVPDASNNEPSFHPCFKEMSEKVESGDFESLEKAMVWFDKNKPELYQDWVKSGCPVKPIS